MYVISNIFLAGFNCKCMLRLYKISKNVSILFPFVHKTKPSSIYRRNHLMMSSHTEVSKWYGSCGVTFVPSKYSMHREVRQARSPGGGGGGGGNFPPPPPTPQPKYFAPLPPPPPPTIYHKNLLFLVFYNF